MRAVHLLLSIIFLASVLIAQTGASVNGRVTTNRSPAAASVVLKKGGKIIAKTTTDAEGKYSFQKIPVGNYTVEAELTDDKNYEQKKQIVVSGQETTVDEFDFTKIACGTLRNCPGIAETVTVSADASQPVEEVSKTVNIIGGQEMRDRADITLVDSLRTIPGFRVQQLGGFGRTASIKSRGLRNQDTAVLIDGVRFRDSASITGDATAFLSDLTLTSVSKVEVLRGPGSSLYGTNAIGGTIDFQTPIPQSGWHGQVSGAGGGLGLGRFRGNVSKGTSDGKFGFNAAVSRTVYTKGIDGDDKANNTNVQSRVEFNPFSTTNVSARFFFSDAFVALNSSPDTDLNPPASNNGIIVAVPNVNFVFDANDPDNSQRSKFFNGQLVLTQVINNQLTFQGHYSGLTTTRTNDNGILGTGFQSASTSIFEGTIHTANGHFDWTPNSYNRVTAGYEFERENFRNEGSTPSGTEDYFTNADQSSHAFYFQDLVSLLDGRLQFAGGFRAQLFQLGTPGFSLNNAPYSNLTLENPPSAITFDGSASYYISSTGTKLRSHAGNGYRVPSLYERFGTFFNTFPSNAFVALGDPGLKPEKTTAFDAGVDQNFLGRKITASATFFYTRLIDTIGFGNSALAIGSTPRPFGGYINTKGGVARGFEFSGSVKPTSSTDIFASYTYTNSDQLVPQVSGTGVFRTLGIPSSQLTLNATQRIKKFWINADLLASNSYLAPIFSNSTFGTYIYRFEGNRRLDLTAGYTFTFDQSKYNLRVFGTIENLLDYEYFENGFRTIGRTGRVGISFGF
ncbi:MAG: TonB-dependent receptor [Acidobacteria bacterium]|nr:TonB-dependent receptor [Acidobacteriota bacterium]